ncbi:hypothetical protein PoB_002870700 [Plakobranchus ocellatus]|uniref:Uncharacterized protein n=1 Tax=Plakobranchus ocellatus TaxID=259542 RepID=A0AAV4A5R5_9GAST|nr:hypothetical protein PoB_002870700 [Plakobranchus ocellatus]
MKMILSTQLKLDACALAEVNPSTQPSTNELAILNFGHRAPPYHNEGLARIKGPGPQPRTHADWSWTLARLSSSAHSAEATLQKTTQ